MLHDPPADAKMLFVNEDIYPTWCAALLEDGTILNRWYDQTDAPEFALTEMYIYDIILEYYTMPDEVA